MEWYQILMLVFALMLFVHMIGFVIYANFDDKWDVFNLCQVILNMKQK